MRAFKFLLLGFMTAVIVGGTVGVFTISQGEDILKLQKAIPQASFVKKFFE